jgi:hypothetical protein
MLYYHTSQFNLQVNFRLTNKNVAVKILLEGWVKKKPERITEVLDKGNPIQSMSKLRGRSFYFEAAEHLSYLE